ncbi:MAG TPA: ATP-binding cassette domain-containing protein [Rhodothermales bacterium]
MIRIEHLAKSLDGQEILHDVNLSVNDGEVFTLIGRSGSGKTLLLKHLTGLQVPDAGRVVVDDVDLVALSREELQEVRRRFGVLFQNGALFDYLTVYENTAFPLRMLTSWPERRIADRVAECLALVELPDAGSRLPSQLSGGQRKRVSLARAIVFEPEYLFYDEPTTGLDPETSATIERLIARLAAELNVTSFVVTHDMHSVFAIADRVGFLQGGTMQFVGTVDEMRRCADEELCAFMKASEYQV